MEAKQSWNRFLTPAREEDLEDLYKEVMGTGSANTQTEEKPFYLKAAETRSAKIGIPTQQLLATYSERLKNSSYPTPDCLTTDEIQACVGQSTDVGSPSPCRILRRLSERFRSDPTSY
jgi:hypothetical protein